MMELVGQHQRKWFKYSKRTLAGAGIQTAALAFGGFNPAITGATEEYDGSSLDNFSCKFSNSKKRISRSWNTNSALAFGGETSSLFFQQQQKNLQ
jgi:hypothetical protein